MYTCCQERVPPWTPDSLGAGGGDGGHYGNQIRKISLNRGEWNWANGSDGSRLERCVQLTGKGNGRSCNLVLHQLRSKWIRFVSLPGNTNIVTILNVVSFNFLNRKLPIRFSYFSQFFSASSVHSMMAYVHSFCQTSHLFLFCRGYARCQSVKVTQGTSSHHRFTGFTAGNNMSRGIKQSLLPLPAIRADGSPLLNLLPWRARLTPQVASDYSSAT